jgi:hypothetical protein
MARPINQPLTSTSIIDVSSWPWLRERFRA